ncbi:Fes1-domain-containing protein, partial [Calocera viscosa TUFC12733]
MESLLRWSIENTDVSSPEHTASLQTAAHSRMQNLDPGLIDAILGKPDAVKMKESMALASDTGRTVSERLQALDDLELLVESIDNANDLAKLALWQPLMSLMREGNDELQQAALWVAGTAVQNNPQAQADFLALDPIPLLLQVLGSREAGKQTRSRAVYALSGSVNHNADAVARMAQAGGWQVLREALTADPDITVRRKVAFLLNTLLLLDGPSPSNLTSSESSAAPHPRAQKEFSTLTTGGHTRTALQQSGIISALIRGVHPTTAPAHGADGDERGDVDFQEKAGRALMTYLEGTEGEPWTAEQKREL